jgi:hypothetical protein
MLRHMALLRTDVSEKSIANVVPSSLILVTLMMEVIRSSETSDLTRATCRYIQEDDILHSHRRENLKSYIALTGWALYRRRNISCEVRTGFLYPRTRHSS